LTAHPTLQGQIGSYNVAAFSNTTGLIGVGRYVAGSGTTTLGQVFFVSNGNVQRASISCTEESSGSAAYLSFFTRDSANVLAERMRLESSGNLGIGTTSPVYKLDVSGSARITGDGLFSGSVLLTGAAGLGYGTGSGGAVTQATSRTTGVTLNKTNGAITLVSAAGTTTWQSFTVTNSTVAATDTVIVNQKSGTDLYMIHVTNVAAGSFQITFATTGGTTTEQPVFNFSIIKAVTS
jgi:hypothetical protein